MQLGFLGRPRRLVAAAVPLLVLGACGGDDDDATAAADTAAGTVAASGTEADGTAADPAATGAEPVTLRLGYFPNVTHAPAIIGVEDGLFEAAVGDDVTIELTTFNSGTEAIEALFADAIDMSFIGPNPAINGYSQSDGEALRIVAGTTSGGAALVVREGIETADDLAGATLATPSLGNTQDVALRAWLADQGHRTDTAGGGDVRITPQDNPDTLAALQSGDLDGAWVPEPWATRLVLEGGGHVLLDEAELWPEGQFVTTHLISATGFLEDHPDVVRDLITGLGEAIDQANGDAATAQGAVNDGIERVTTSRLGDDTIAGAWENLEFTLDPIASSLQGSADDAIAVGLLDEVDLADPGIYSLDLLNEVRAERGEDPVDGLAAG